MLWQITEEISVKHLPSSEPDPHVVRVGWSLDSCSTQLGEWKMHKTPNTGDFNKIKVFALTFFYTLGEEPFSYGYGGTGKKSFNCKFEDYGQKFGENDIIGCYVVSSPEYF